MVALLSRKRKYVGQREELIKDIPHSKVLHTIDESEQICEKCGGSTVKAGEEFVRTEVQFIPARLKVIDHYRETYECRSCRKQGTPYMEKAPVPYPPVLHSLASASTIAWLIHQKFELGIPLYRQEKEWEVLGLKLSRATMSNWLLVVFRDWLSCFYLKQLVQPKDCFCWLRGFGGMDILRQCIHKGAAQMGITIHW